MALRNKIKLGLVLSAFFIGGYVAGKITGVPADQVKIYYLAQDELIRLEQDRIKDIPFNERQIFMGRGADAVKIAIELGKAYEGPKSKLVLSEKPVSGVGVSSISEEVHERLIAILSEGKK